MVFHSKQKGLGRGRLTVGKKLGIEIALASVNDAAASRLFCATLRGNVSVLLSACAPAAQRKGSARTRSPDVDRDQRPKFVGWWRVEWFM